MAGRGQPLEQDELVVNVMELCLRAVWLAVKAAWAAVVMALRHPLLALGAAGGWMVDHLVGRNFTIWATLVFLVALVVWRLAWPTSFRRFVGLPAAQAWRGFAYRLWWPHVAARHGLIARSMSSGQDGRMDQEAAKLGKVKVTTGGIERLQIKLPVGLKPADVERVSDGLASAFRVSECRVTADRPGQVWVELHRRDVLAAIVRPMAIRSGVDLAGVPVGKHEDGKDWLFRLLGTHVLIAGATGAGKGSVIWSLLRGLAGRIGDGSVQVWAIDPKGGMELGPGKPMFTRFEDQTPERMCELLEELVTVKDVRAKALAAQGLRKHTASPHSPHLLIVVDELATLTAFAERKVTARIDRALGLLLTQGRACGITVLAAVQDPGKDVVGWRDLFPTRLAMRLDNPIQVDMVLGDGARDQGARADHISELTPGVAYMRVEGTRAIRRVRASYLTDDDITHLAATYPAPRSTSHLELVDDGSDAA
jgi:S-DNA-T family DNA segregation ATPase FtsK/SpoIIIE